MSLHLFFNCHLSPSPPFLNYLKTRLVEHLSDASSLLSDFNMKGVSLYALFFTVWRNIQTRARAVSLLRFLNHTQWHVIVGWTPLDEGSAHRRDVYLTTLTRDKHPRPGGIRTSNPSKRVAADPRLRPLGHWDWLFSRFSLQIRTDKVNFSRELWRATSSVVKRFNRGLYRSNRLHLKPASWHDMTWYFTNFVLTKDRA